MTKHETTFERSDRRRSVIVAAERSGLMGGARRQVGVRIPESLLEAAQAKTGLTSNTEILEYALAKVALEDDFGPALLKRKGRIPSDLDLEF